eukprot:CAMPEP_0182552668 /NCGR_PEP_ID=MMETSP1323-20130603/49079_1 /TAXON_ID=236787 /ORGANISM="Florenciella parvula, Strain RCC1693" /LENGTH=34 /DNA_ID= /DNA_START= /DNA_END= /DNA_ORIENTATION=
MVIGGWHSYMDWYEFDSEPTSDIVGSTAPDIMGM